MLEYPVAIATLAAHSTAAREPRAACLCRFGRVVKVAFFYGKWGGFFLRFTSEIETWVALEDIALGLAGKVACHQIEPLKATVPLFYSVLFLRQALTVQCWMAGDLEYRPVWL